MSSQWIFVAPSLLLLAAACSHAEAQPSDEPTAQGGAAGAAGMAAGTGGMAAGKGGMAGAGAGTGGTSGGAAGESGGTGGAGGGAGGPVATHLVVNEIAYKSDSSDDDEFVELYNPTASDVSLSGFQVLYASASGSPTPAWTGASGDTIKKGGYFVLGGAKFSGSSSGKLGTALGAKGGSITLTDGGATLDLVGWGTSQLAEGAAAPADASTSLSRIPDGSDSDDNATDFVVGARTPGAKNQP